MNSSIFLPPEPYPFQSLRRDALTGNVKVNAISAPGTESIPHHMVPEAAATGRDALIRGEVAIVTPIGGRSTRYDGEFRGDISLSPVVDATLLELQGHRIAWARKISRDSLHWIIMVSAYTRHVIEEIVSQFQAFGFPRSKIITVHQPLYPVLTEDFQSASDPAGENLLVPGGNGALVTAMVGELGRQLRSLGVRYLALFNYSNLLERVCDLVPLGWHILTGADITLKAVEAEGWQEPAGRIVKDGKRNISIVEYHYNSLLSRKFESASFPIFTGSAFISFPGKFFNARLPWHKVRHQEPGDSRNLWKAEQFINDIVASADAVNVLACERASEYAPVKSKTGDYSLASALSQMEAELGRCETVGLAWHESRQADLSLRT
jgi:UDP-N-acetylglucosamine pyrophosphorylase